MRTATVTDMIRAHLLEGVVLAPYAPVPLAHVRAHNDARLALFEHYRANRLGFGFYRYEGAGAHRNVEACMSRLRAYLLDGNQEHLVDVANLCGIEFIRPGSHPAPHWSPVDGGEHVAPVAPADTRE